MSEELKDAKYINTEIGLIPADWSITTLGKVGLFSKGKGIKKDEVQSDGIPCVRYGELYTKYDNLITSFHSYISEEIANQSCLIKEGDILFAGSGETREEIGKCAALLYSDKVYAGGDIIILRPANYDSTFLGYLLNAPIVVKQKSVKGQGDAVVHIYSSGLSTIKIPVPPKPEQQAIATALSDVDTLISNLDKLITKKKAIKQGAMQRLLKSPAQGGQRLPGFEGEWAEIRLGDYADITKLAGFEYSKHFNSYRDGGEIIVIRGTNITNNKLDFTDVKTIPKSVSQFLKRSQLKKGDLVFAYVGTIGPVCLIQESEKYHLGPNTARITLSQELDSLFVFSCFTSPLIAKEIELHTSTGAQPSLSMTKIRSFKLNVPPTVSEQNAIACILSDIDKEIESLETKKSKYLRIKQGMMQELLTGKTRLV